MTWRCLNPDDPCTPNARCTDACRWVGTIGSCPRCRYEVSIDADGRRRCTFCWFEWKPGGATRSHRSAKRRRLAREAGK